MEPLTRCTRERDFPLRVSGRLVKTHHATGHLEAIEAIEARTGDQRPSYGARLRHLDAVGASTLIELHGDALAETHNAKDGLETVLWEAPETHHTFACAILAGLVAFHGGLPGLERDVASPLRRASYPPDPRNRSSSSRNMKLKVVRLP